VLEIIENEKGLLISFRIIGAQVGTQPVSASLSLEIGDLLPKQTAVVR
jgi:hypothetical protein